MPSRSIPAVFVSLSLLLMCAGCATGQQMTRLDPLDEALRPTPLVPTTDPRTESAPRPESAPVRSNGSPLSVFGELESSNTGRNVVEQANSGSLRQITNAPVGADFDPHISRDGQFIVYASTQHRTSSDIYLKRVNSSVITQLTNHPAEDVMPTISPDGKRIAFASNRTGNWDIYIMPTKGGKAVQITNDPAHELHPSWSPDGSSLVFCRMGEQSGQWELWVVDVSNPSLTHFIGHGLFPQWSPVSGKGLDGADQILFQRSRQRGDRRFALWTIDYANGQAGSPSELASHADMAYVNPAWSPDGRHVVFASISDSAGGSSGSSAQQSDLWMIGIDGNGLVNLTQGTARDLMPTWGTDHQIYFVSSRGNRENIWSLDARPALMAASGESANPNAFATTPGARAPVASAPVD